MTVDCWLFYYVFRAPIQGTRAPVYSCRHLRLMRCYRDISRFPAWTNATRCFSSLGNFRRFWIASFLFKWAQFNYHHVEVTENNVSCFSITFWIRWNLYITIASARIKCLIKRPRTVWKCIKNKALIAKATSLFSNKFNFISSPVTWTREHPTIPRKY